MTEFDFDFNFETTEDGTPILANTKKISITPEHSNDVIINNEKVNDIIVRKEEQQKIKSKNETLRIFLSSFKRTKIEESIPLSLDMITKESFNFIKENAVFQKEEVIDFIVDSLDMEEIKKQIKTYINEKY